MRAYSGINVAKDASVFFEPAQHLADLGADNLLRMG